MALLVLCCSLRFAAAGQQLQLWQAVASHNESLAPRQHIYRHTAGLHWSWNPLKMGVRTAMFVYQRKLTYQIPSQCIYTPSCSEFGRQCYEHYGPIKATLLTLDRLTRCSPSALSGLSRFDRVSLSGRTLYLDPPSRYRFRPKR